jgi:hypothetical protein
MVFSRIVRPFVPVLFLSFVACSQPTDETVATTRPEVVTRQAAVAIADPYAAAIATDVLRQGASAVAASC